MAGGATSGERLAQRALAQYARGELEAAIATWEEMHAELAAVGDRPGAARAATMAALLLLVDTGLMAPVRGWIGRAERQLEETEEGAEHAWVAAVRSYERFFSGDAATAAEQASRAALLGQRFGVVDAAVIGDVAAARLQIHRGDVAEGMHRLDELGIRLMAEDIDPLTRGIMYCELICAAQGLARFDRAREWTDVMARWSAATAGSVNGRCRVHRAELLRLSGPAERAEAEAQAALQALSPWLRRELGWPLVELGEIRLRRGDLPGAEDAFLEAHRRAWSPYPGLALLRLAQGDPAQALALITEAIAHPWNIPSKEQPPVGELRMAPLHAAQVEIAAATGDLAAVERSVLALADIARCFPSPGLVATEVLARARWALAEDRVGEAIRHGSDAATRWAELDAPFECSQARTLLGTAHQRAGNDDLARLEWQAARAGFAEYGARGWTERLDGLLASGPGGSTVRPPAPVRADFRVVGDTRVIRFAGQEVTLRDLLGFRYLERLLAEPGRERHVLELVALEHQAPADGAVGGTAFDGPTDGLSIDDPRGLPVLDDLARTAYERRLAEVEQDIEEAQRDNDLGRLELAQRDRDFLVDELVHAVGLGGRDRRTGGSAERARASVTRSLRYGVARIAEHHPVLGQHLARGLRTGTYCCYVPDPVAPVEWSTDLGPRRR